MWKAPELLRNCGVYGSQKADVYAFALILYEIISRQGPFGYSEREAKDRKEPKEIIELVKQVPEDGKQPFRPDLDYIAQSPEYVIDCIKDCWDEMPEKRPDFTTIR